MKYRMLLTSAMLAAMLSACGGGSGSVNSTPTPTPAPSPTNTTLANLKVNQSFVNDAASTKATFDLATRTGISDSAGASALTVAYDAKTNGYTVTANGRTQTFLPADLTSQAGYDTIFAKTGTGSSDRLTLTRTGYTSTTPLNYVGLGYWQHNETSGDRQDMELTSFTYGLPTAVSAVPRTGTAEYAIDVFGLVTKPGEEPRSFVGDGTFNVDFSKGIFTSQAYTQETSLVSGAGNTGGGIELVTSGYLSGTDGSFSGLTKYGSAYGDASGMVDGRFYGPNGQEIGASFHAENSDGMAANGSFIGAATGAAATANLALTGMHQEQYFVSRWTPYSYGTLTWQNADTFLFGPPSSGLPGGQFSAADKVSGTDSNYTSYRKHYDMGGGTTYDVTLDMFKPGAANAQLALTYASFGHWTAKASSNGVQLPRVEDNYFTYGLATQPGTLGGMTGSAHYGGIALGNGVDSTAGTAYTVSGTSQFDMDFSTSQFSGTLALGGTEKTTGTQVDFGRFDFNGAVPVNGTTLGANIARADGSSGTLSAGFFGPMAEEIAGPFTMSVTAGGTGSFISIEGIVAAKR